jgi:preprotein translocase subunit Sss1
MTRDGRLLDNAPIADGGTALVFSKGQWVLFEGTFGELTDSIPVTAEEAMRFCEDGVLPERVSKATTKPRWQHYLENLKAAGWRVTYKQHKGLRSSHWKAKAVKGGKRLTVTGATLEYVLMRLWQIS